MKTPLWKPSAERIKQANVTRFIEYVNKKQGKKIGSYIDLYQWSIDTLVEEVRSVKSLGISGIMLFGIPAKKDDRATGATRIMALYRRRFVR
jgi:delta-aminolevulinic acid dehydratase/porphobilinogen synthase